MKNVFDFDDWMWFFSYYFNEKVIDGANKACLATPIGKY